MTAKRKAKGEELEGAPPELEAAEPVEIPAQVQEKPAADERFLCRRCGFIAAAGERGPHEIDCRVRELPESERWQKYEP